jgi:hypothetical protein
MSVVQRGREKGAPMDPGDVALDDPYSIVAQEIELAFARIPTRTLSAA